MPWPCAILWSLPLLPSRPHPRVSIVATIGWRACTAALWAEDLSSLSLSSWRHRIVSGSHRICGELRNHRSRGWGRMVRHLWKPRRLLAPRSLSCYDQWLGFLLYTCRGLLEQVVRGITSKRYSVLSSRLHHCAPSTVRANFIRSPQWGPMGVYLLQCSHNQIILTFLPF